MRARFSEAAAATVDGVRKWDPVAAVWVREPFAPSTKGAKKWHPIEEVYTLAYKDVYNAKAQDVDAKQFKNADNQDITMVALTKKAEWIQQMAGGVLKRAGRVFDTMRERYDEVIAPVAECDAAADAQGSDAASDPMLQLDVLDDPTTPETKRRRTDCKPNTPCKRFRG